MMMELEDIIQKTLDEFKREIQKIYVEKLYKLILYGSHARGNAGKDSDIDLAVVLKGKVNPGKEIDRMLDVLVDLNLKYQVLISVYPVSEEDFLSRASPLLINIRSKGVSL
jgi:predicted nucleotidyltransferase